MGEQLYAKDMQTGICYLLQYRSTSFLEAIKVLMITETSICYKIYSPDNSCQGGSVWKTKEELDYQYKIIEWFADPNKPLIPEVVKSENKSSDLKVSDFPCFALSAGNIVYRDNDYMFYFTDDAYTVYDREKFIGTIESDKDFLDSLFEVEVCYLEDIKNGDYYFYGEVSCTYSTLHEMDRYKFRNNNEDILAECTDFFHPKPTGGIHVAPINALSKTQSIPCYKFKPKG